MHAACQGKAAQLAEGRGPEGTAPVVNRRGGLGQEVQNPGQDCGGIAAAGWIGKAAWEPGVSGRNEVGRDKAGRGVG